MGFRTVIVLNNDQAHEWSKDPNLGDKIWISAVAGTDRDADLRTRFPYGEIVEQVHADCETLAVLDGYGGRSLVHASWYHNKTQQQTEEELLKKLAKRLGYRVSRIKSTV